MCVFVRGRACGCGVHVSVALHPLFPSLLPVPPLCAHMGLIRIVPLILPCVPLVSLQSLSPPSHSRALCNCVLSTTPPPSVLVPHASCFVWLRTQDTIPPYCLPLSSSRHHPATLCAHMCVCAWYDCSMAPESSQMDSTWRGACTPLLSAYPRRVTQSHSRPCMCVCVCSGQQGAAGPGGSGPRSAGRAEAAHDQCGCRPGGLHCTAKHQQQRFVSWVKIG